MQFVVVETDAVDSSAAQLDVLQLDTVELEAVVLYLPMREGVESGVVKLETVVVVIVKPNVA